MFCSFQDILEIVAEGLIINDNDDCSSTTDYKKKMHSSISA